VCRQSTRLVRHPHLGRGISPASLVAGVGVSQLIMLVFHIGLRLLFAYITGPT
jgi:glycosyltransferase 2 family protein